jgi:hypothetical protein
MQLPLRIQMMQEPIRIQMMQEPIRMGFRGCRSQYERRSEDAGANRKGVQRMHLPIEIKHRECRG